MKLGRVIGRVVSTKKMECFEGLKLLLVQPVDENGTDAGAPIVAFDTVRAGEGVTRARTFTRERRCTLVDSFRII